MHAQIAASPARAEGGSSLRSFDTQNVASQVVDKLIRRHPHVFGDVLAEDADQVLRNWDQIKAAEKGDQPASLLAGVPQGMASLLRAYEVSKRAARAGFEWPDLDGVWDKLAEEEAELREAIGSGDSERIESELGDLLFTAVNLARWTGVEPEEALRKMLNRFTERFQTMEHLATKPLDELSPLEWDLLWNTAKIPR
jgi:tetrapyrrole methylase family protein/MazG family protein